MQQNDGTNVFQSPDPQLPPYGYALQTPGRQLDHQSTTPPSIPRQSTKKRKLGSFDEQAQALDYEGQDDHEGSVNGLIRNGSNRKSRQNGTKRACNQCRQQKVSYSHPPHYQSRVQATNRSSYGYLHRHALATRRVDQSH